MEEVRWDREQFVQQQQHPKKQSVVPALAGLFLLVVTIGVVAGGGYWYLKSRGYAASLPEIKLPSMISPGPSALEQKLDELDLRLAQIEKRLGLATPAAKPSTTGPAAARPAQAARPTQAAASSSAASAPAPAPTAPQYTASIASPATDDSEREAWEATTDRLGMAVGELGEQRRAIAQTRETLDEIRQQMERTATSFQLRRNAGRQTVGPIAIELQSTDTRNQRYSLRVYFDDRAVQMKDRALGERVEFYIGGVDGPLELVVSEIAPNMVFGKLAVPPTSDARPEIRTAQ